MVFEFTLYILLILPNGGLANQRIDGYAPRVQENGLVCSRRAARLNVAFIAKGVKLMAWCGKRMVEK